MTTQIVGIPPDNPRIVYDERVAAPDGSEVIARLSSDGTLRIGRTEERLREVVFYTDPQTGEPWVPNRKVFVEVVQEALTGGEYDLDGEVLCLESFMSRLCQSLKNDKILTESPTDFTT